MNVAAAWDILKEIAVGLVWLVTGFAGFLWTRYDRMREEQIRHDEQIQRLISDAESEKETRRRENVRHNERLDLIHSQLAVMNDKLATLIGKVKARTSK